MPTYEYEREDGTRFELEQRISEDSLKACPTTGQKVRRVIHAGAFQLKGSGWYKSDYASPAKGRSRDEGASEKKEGGEKKESGGEATTASGHACGGGGCGCKTTKTPASSTP